jgi:NAD(P)H-flavin reductase
MPTQNVKTFFLFFTKKVKIAKDLYVIIFDRKKVPFTFLPGQYIQMTLPHENVDERGSSRYFTIASSPTEKDVLMITSRKGRSSFKKALFGLKAGDRVQFFGPMGVFVLPD